MSAIRQLRQGDIGLDARRILKNWETDKENVEQWVPVPDALQPMLREAMGPANEYVFPAPKDRTKPWSRYYARRLLRRCEKAAGLTPLKGGQWHPFRRKWVTERKHLPMTDVAEAGGWRSVRTLDIYAQPDEKTILAVVNEPNKLWEVK